jgi:hypothetical protein
MPLPIRFEPWDDIEANGGERQAVFKDVLTAEWSRTVDGKDDLTLSAPAADPAWAFVVEESVIRVVENDTDFIEFRVRTITNSQKDSFMRDLMAEGIRFDLLSNSELLERIEANGLAQMHFEVYGRPPSEQVDIILGAFAPFHSGAPSYFSKGTIEPTEEVDMIYDWDSPYSALQELAEITGSELSVRRDGVSGYFIDLLFQTGAGGDEPLFTIGRNILSVEHESSSKDQATRLYPKGGSIDGWATDISQNGFIVTGVSGNDLTLDEDIVLEADQWNGFWLMQQDGSIVAISDSSVPNVITVPGHSSGEDDIVTLVRNAAGAGLTYVDLPSEQPPIKSRVHDRTDLPGINNWAWNGFLQHWTQGGRGDAPCMPDFLGGASDCIRRTVVGSSVTGSGPEGPILPQGWVHRVTSTGAINDAAALTYLNTALGLNLGASNFGYYDFTGLQFTSTSAGFAINIGAYGTAHVIDASIALDAGGGCEFAGLVAKWHGPDNYYYAEIGPDGGIIKAKLYKVVGGVTTQLGATYSTGSSDCTTPWLLKLVVGDAGQVVYVAGVQAVVAADSTFSGVEGFGGIYAFGAGPEFNSIDAVAGGGNPPPGSQTPPSAGTNEIVMTGLPVGWTIEACGVSPAAADANGKAVLDLGSASIACSTIIVKDGGAVVQDTFSPTDAPVGPGDVYVWSCTDANPSTSLPDGSTGISPDLNRTNRGCVTNEQFDAFQCPTLGSSCWWRFPLSSPIQSFSQDITCIAPFDGYVDFSGAPAGTLIGRSWCSGKSTLLVQSTVSLVSTTNADVGVMGRISTSNNGYEAYIDSAGLKLARIDAGVRTTIDSAATSIAADTEYVIQLHVAAGVQEAQLWSGGSVVATVSATDGTYSGTFHATFTHLAAAGADTSRHAHLFVHEGKDIVFTNLPTGATVKLLDDTGATVASASESGGTATIDVFNGTEPITINGWRAATVELGGNEVSRYDGVICAGDTYGVGST